MMDWAAIALAARRAQAVYIMDAAKAKAAFEGLGDSFVAQYQDDDSQAVLSTDVAGAWHLSLSGTRFSDMQIGDLIDDLQTDALDLGNGAKVTRGPYESAKQIFDWALKLVPTAAVISVCGHSLGGWRTAYTPCFLSSERIGALHAFEPPKGANAAYYAKYQKELAGLTICANGRDIWFGYPRLGYWIHRPGKVVWLTSTGFQLIDSSAWLGGLSLADHSIDLVVDRLEKIAAAPLKPAA
jgi:hypothetical protein